MKKSFLWHIFIRICIVVTIIIYSNRILASYMTTATLNSRIQENIAYSLWECKNNTNDVNIFLLCSAQAGKHDAIANLSEYFSVCGENYAASGNQSKTLCSDVSASNPKNITTMLQASISMTRLVINQEEWLKFSTLDDPAAPTILIRQADIDHYINRIWNLRDKILIYLLPVVLGMLLLLALYLSYTVMQPVRQIEKTLTQLSSHNLDKPLDLPPQYREFERFVNVFEQLRERLNQGFLQARRFAADASHELRTPLTILRGNSERLIATLPTGSDIQVRMRLMGDEIERLIEITEKLLLLSRADANSIRTDMKLVALSDLVLQLTSDVETFHPNLRMDCEIEPNINYVCDRSLIQQLIYNLYTNAEKYNKEQGWIKIKLARSESKFNLSIENPCDNIPHDLQQRAFERFYRGDTARGRKVDGIGLGLALCMEIARLHHATLELHGTENQTVIATLHG